jgi:predicted transposase YdaD
MAKPWDDIMKRLFFANPQHFISWLMPGAILLGERNVVLKSRTLETDTLYNILMNGIAMILHVEFQRRGETEMGKRLWAYNAMATITSDLPVQTIVIYLKKDRKVDDAPYRLKLPTGEVSHIFNYQRIKLWELAAEVFKQPGLEGLLPLLPLTKDGVRREVVDEVIQGLILSNKTDLLPLSYMLASLVFEKPGEREWLDRRFAMFQDILRESYVYQTILREGLEEGLEQGLEKGLEQGREQTLRQTLMTYVETRFPKLALLAEQQTSTIKDATVLHTVLAKLFMIQTPEEAEQYLLSLGDDSKKN